MINHRVKTGLYFIHACYFESFLSVFDPSHGLSGTCRHSSVLWFCDEFDDASDVGNNAHQEILDLHTGLRAIPCGSGLVGVDHIREFSFNTWMLFFYLCILGCFCPFNRLIISVLVVVDRDGTAFFLW